MDENTHWPFSQLLLGLTTFFCEFKFSLPKNLRIQASRHLEKDLAYFLTPKSKVFFKLGHPSLGACRGKFTGVSTPPPHVTPQNLELRP